jgi:hypothetical protein
VGAIPVLSVFFLSERISIQMKQTTEVKQLLYTLPPTDTLPLQAFLQIEMTLTSIIRILPGIQHYAAQLGGVMKLWCELYSEWKESLSTTTGVTLLW